MTAEQAGPHDFELGIPGFRFVDLHGSERLAELLATFDATLRAADAPLSERLMAYRACRGEGMAPQAVSGLIVDVAPHLSAFIARLFGIEDSKALLARDIASRKVVFDFKAKFLRERVGKTMTAASLEGATLEDLTARFAPVLAAAQEHFAIPDAERACATLGMLLLADEKATAAGAPRDAALAGLGERLASRRLVAEAPALLGLLERWCFAVAARHGRTPLTRGWASFRKPETLDFQALVELERPDPAVPEHLHGPAWRHRRRDGFKLTDRRYEATDILYEVDYCVLCHERSKDSCSKGIFEKTGALKRNPLGINLAGCPLDEKISEAHMLKGRGDSLAALAAIMIDNPMAPGTGHRICNDCMKACIFQKQEPVNIPQIETSILTDVLELPYGVEIYGLLCRWNPLNPRRPVALPYNGKNVLVVGLGPAGYTLAHYLRNEGFGVVGIDGLKLEPLDPLLTGERLLDDGPKNPGAIRDYASICSELDERAMAGFGGVSEYGITVRWDKNFLNLIYLALARRDYLRMYGGIRFGGTLTVEDAWEMGFDHVAIAAGAGKPTVLDMENAVIRGIRTASDFLMALQLTGAAKRSSLANLQVRLPAIVIGGGLTAIDTTTELLAYYPVQVEKLLERYELLSAEIGESRLLASCDEEERGILDEQLSHGRAVRAERARAAAAGEMPEFSGLVQGWGGVTMVYRKSLVDSPAYRLNHEEIIKALEEGIHVIEKMSPTRATADRYGAVESLEFERQEDLGGGKWRATGEKITLPCRSVCVAAGTVPNVIYEKERPGTFALDERRSFFKSHRVEAAADGSGPRQLVPVAKGGTGFFTSYQSDGRFVSFYGDNHPVYAGNVVKAMASARDGYPRVVELFASELAALDPAAQLERDAGWRRLVKRLNDDLIATVVRVDRLTPTIVEVIVHAPLAARKFRPGQFYRLQNYEANAPVVRGMRLAMEGIALTGAWVDAGKGLLSLIVLEMGVSSKLCVLLKPGERVVVMGPTGEPTHIPQGETVLLAGGGLGNAVLFSIAKALKAAGNKVLYFAGYKKGIDLFKRDEIEAATDQVVWSVDSGEAIPARRGHDASFTGNIVQAILAYGRGEIGDRMFSLKDATRIIAIGSDRMMAAMKEARHGVLAEHLGPHTGIGSINSLMQCMMKEVCGQCLQLHVDPATGKPAEIVFSCFNQDQPLDAVDFKNLNARLKVNSVQEKLGNMWLDHVARELLARR